MNHACGWVRFRLSPHFCTEDSAQMCATRWKGTTCRRRCTSVPRTNVLVVAEAVSGTAVALLRLQSSSRYEKVKSTAAVVYRQFFYLADVAARMRDGGLLRADEGERPPLPDDDDACGVSSAERAASLESTPLRIDGPRPRRRRSQAPACPRVIHASVPSERV